MSTEIGYNDEFIKGHENILASKDDANRNNNSVTINPYHEEIVTELEYARSVSSNPVTKIRDYIVSLFPIARWIVFYNQQWLTYDLIAGITVGVVLVPQSMSYATLAGLDAQYGLYSSFVGVFIYCFFATSKDVSIGPVAVMSTQVGKVVAKVQEAYPDASAPIVATFLSLVCGAIALGLGVLRLGFILEFIPNPAVFAFMTGSAMNIMAGQVPALMGYNSDVNTRDSTYRVIINTLKLLPNTTYDAAFGLICLFILYAWKFGCDIGMKRYPRAKTWFFYTQVLRHAVVIVVATLISWGITKPYQKRHPGEKLFSIIGVVPSGLRETGVMTIPEKKIISVIAPEIPVSVIILLLEHISISKSFGRLNDYKVVPDQEMIAIGVTNLIGTFFNAYPATGSFSRSALKAKCGVRTPFAGIFTGAVVLLALYCLTKAFYYIPKAALSAIIIHCVSDLVASWRVTLRLYQTSFLDFAIFIVGVFITIFATIEDGIYFSVCAAVAVVLWRLSKPNGVFLGKVQVAEVVNARINNRQSESSDSDIVNVSSDVKSEFSKSNGAQERSVNASSASTSATEGITFHTRWVPLPSDASPIHTSLVNPDVKIVPPPNGVLVFRPSESFTYPNSSRQLDYILDEVKRTTQPHESRVYKTVGDRPWNNTPPFAVKSLPVVKAAKLLLNRGKKEEEFHYTDSEENSLESQEIDSRSLIRIIHFDFSCVTAVDSTSVQALVDLHKAIFRYSGVDVEFHFSGILSPWIRKSLLAAGFGRPHSEPRYRDAEEEVHGSNKNYLDVAPGSDEALVSLLDTDTPFIHLEIPTYE